MKKKDLIFGRNAVIEALKESRNIDHVLIYKNAQGEEIQEIINYCKKASIPFKKVDNDKIQYLLYPFYKNTKLNHQGVIAIVTEYKYIDVEDIYNQNLDLGKNSIFVYLDSVTDVRNFGAIARSAYCFDIDALIIPIGSTATVNADSIKTSAGALNHIKVSRVSSVKETFDFFVNCGFQIIGASEKSSDSFKSIDFTLPTILILGNEGHGISKLLTNYITKNITIPMNNDKFDSLNVSVSAGIIFSEIFCQNQ